MTAAVPNIPLPIIDDSSRPYWEAASRGKLLIQECRSCGRRQFYPRAFCAECLEPDPAWIEATGNGRIHTFSIVHRNSDPRFQPDLPYVLAIIELDEGVRLTARVIDAPPERLRCEMPVRIVFPEIREGFRIPYARPAEDIDDGA